MATFTKLTSWSIFPILQGLAPARQLPVKNRQVVIQLQNSADCLIMLLIKQSFIKATLLLILPLINSWSTKARLPNPIFFFCVHYKFVVQIHNSIFLLNLFHWTNRKKNLDFSSEFYLTHLTNPSLTVPIKEWRHTIQMTNDRLIYRPGQCAF